MTKTFPYFHFAWLLVILVTCSGSGCGWFSESGTETGSDATRVAKDPQVQYAEGDRPDLPESKVDVLAAAKSIRAKGDLATGIPWLAYDSPGIDHMDVSANGERIAAISRGTLYFWKSNGSLLWSREVGECEWVALSPNGETIATSPGLNIRDLDRTDPAIIKVWNAANGSPINELELISPRAEQLAFSPDGKTLAVAQGNTTNYPGDGYISFWDWKSGREIARTPKQEDTQVELAWSEDGKLFATSEHNELIVWDAGTKKKLFELETRFASDLEFSPDNRYLAGYTGLDHELRVWDVQKKTELKLAVDTQPEGSSVAWSPDGAMLLTACHDGDHEWYFCLWEIPSCKPLRKIKPGWDNDASVDVLEFLPDGQWFVAGGSSGIHLWKMADFLDEEYGKQLTTLEKLEEFDLIAVDQTFSIDARRVNDESLGKLPVLSKPWSLDLSSCDEITAAGLKVLQKQTELTSLNLRFNDELDDAAFQAIRQFKALKHLDASYTGLTSAGLKNLESLDLESLILQSTEVDASAMETLGKMTSLQELVLNRVEDPDLSPLTNLKELRKLDLSETPISDADVKQFAALTKLEELKLHSCRQVTGECLQSLAPLTELKVLDLGYSSFRDEFSPHLTQFKKLKELYLEDSAATDATLEHVSGMSELTTITLPKSTTDVGLAHLANLTKLQTLDLMGRPITDAGLLKLKDLTAVENVWLDNCNQVDGSGLAAFANSPQLTELGLTSTPITDAGLEGIGKLTQLKKLRLKGEAITDAGVAHLSRLSHLTELKLEGADITDASLDQFRRMESLDSLNIQGTKITKDAAQKLKTERPGLFLWGP